MAVERGAVPAPLAVWRVGMAGARLASADPWLRVKSTRRAVYDAARAALAPGLDEVVFLNERGEVCDGTITTLFFDRGQGMRTPPLSSGLLPGVLRAELAVPEEVLRAEDLPRVRLWLGNSLRGLAPAVWAG
jgi:4-amino-4-deoxychorismate lyase